ncbi:NADH dehydrogenase [ubiquinone] 1 beta subcomplex subunit 3 [Ralstonia soli]|uniref:NADH dehydrogenase [ubiquinone] 1 beta subcomplex subunit 3 n=1 Tax=Ralstonia soli TaxID=2953896 RepID=A0ABT1AEE3_9RALS|nr:NADH dehydrogenase [ubiquinone] 1 beta subcomplex subunit 3 [Ralstonia soli]MCO5396757.1 NADH dehydrogenase [ubiquinone] 1 beta subcomplex subunit 3 [Ralstonia soli]
MKQSHRWQVRTAGPGWGLAFGAFMTAVGVVLWRYMKESEHVTQLDESLAVGAVLIGVFMVIYAGREIHRQKRR